MKKEKDPKEINDTEKNVEADEAKNANKAEKEENASAKTKKEKSESDKNAEIAAKLEKELSEEKDRFVRMYADFENYKKRTAAEKESTYLNAKADTLSEILPIVDNLERALAAAEEENPLKKGVEMVLSQVNSTFTKLGVESYGEKGDAFDPNIHEAVMHGEDENFGENTVAEVFSKGYKIKDKIIRHAMVKVMN